MWGGACGTRSARRCVWRTESEYRQADERAEPLHGEAARESLDGPAQHLLCRRDRALDAFGAPPAELVAPAPGRVIWATCASGARCSDTRAVIWRCGLASAHLRRACHCHERWLRWAVAPPASAYGASPTERHRSTTSDAIRSPLETTAAVGPASKFFMLSASIIVVISASAFISAIMSRPPLATRRALVER